MKKVILKPIFSEIIGKVKPMHAINNAPTVPDDYFGLYKYLSEAAIPYARMHDTGGRYGGARYVDIANIFPNFDADETDPASYDFAFTDRLFCELIRFGVKPFYRLGSTIENYHRIKAYNIYPPKDPSKWARICEHIIMHYNEGWADGYRMGLEYFEIWNEPDNEPEICDNPMWKGTKEQFFELYTITYSHLKSRFPNLKIGGYASCGFYAFSSSDLSHVANSSPRTEYFVEFFLDFLLYIQKHNIGLDFFSWHSYAGVTDNVGYASYVRQTLDNFGYTSTEVFLNEWNPGINERGKLCDASNILTMMIRMQKTPTDMLMYYDSWILTAYCGLFDPVAHRPFPAYYAFLFFGRLYKLGNETKCVLESPDGCDGLCVLSASNDGLYGVTLSNSTDDDIEIVLMSDNDYELTLADGDIPHTVEMCENGFILKARAIAYLQNKN